MKTLGLDLGTNSIGWAVIDSSRKQPVVEKGVQIFEKGVGEEKNVEFSRASKRTTYRAARRLKMRRKYRKIATLTALIENDLCPGLTKEELKKWQNQKIYPNSSDFQNWLKTEVATDGGKAKDPYTYRHLVATKALDLDKEENRYILGRALYHIAQRRGYKSNRVTGEEKDGKVNAAIEKLNKDRAGRALGEFYKEEWFEKERIRGAGHYTARAQYVEEFEAICRKQNIPEDIKSQLFKAIFFQRPLKSQKGSVGPCTLEPRKTRVSISHPAFERFRALQLITNIRLAEPGSLEMRKLTPDEQEKALQWTLTRNKNDKFEKLAKQLVPKRSKINFGTKSADGDTYAWTFNFRADSTVPECPTNARFIKLFGTDWPKTLREHYRKSSGKADIQVEDDIWHSLVNFDDHEKLVAFARVQLGLDEDSAKVFANPVKQGYGSLSLTAVRKILPHLEKGIGYSNAVFLSNLPTIFNAQKLNWEELKSDVHEKIQNLINEAPTTNASQSAVYEALKVLVAEEPDFEPDSFAMPHRACEIRQLLCKGFERNLVPDSRNQLDNESLQNIIDGLFEKVRTIYHKNLRLEDIQKPLTQSQQIKNLLKDTYGITDNGVKRLYHPSAIETYPKTDGKLGSPRIAAIKNPVFMRTMHRVRAVVNELLERGIIDQSTCIRVEMARDLTTANERKAIYRYQKEREKNNERIRNEIQEGGFVASDSAVLKYRLWEEQGKECLYTGKQISLSGFLSDNPQFDIEHTIPRSRRFDDSQSNLTLCDADYNRRVKRNKMPSELPIHDEILQRAHLLWDENIERHESFIRSAKSKNPTEKEAKDQARQDLHYHQQHVRYWREKMRNFETLEVPDGFENRQLVDTRIITKYTVHYLKSKFDRVYSLKASALTAMKDIWGLNAKTRDNHIHHCIDAVVAGSITMRFYADLANYYHEYERWQRNEASKPNTPEPWSGFAQYVNEQLVNEVLVVHHQRDLLLKQTRKVLRTRGKIQRTADGKPIIQQGDSARGSLHQETYYGKVHEVPTKDTKEPGELFTVVRKPLDANFKDIAKIVDPVVRDKVEAQKENIGKETIWFNKEANIPIRHVRIRCKNSENSLIELRPHRDQSKHHHKQKLYVANDSNYTTALYRGVVNGKPKAAWKIVSNIEAVRAQKLHDWQSILPDVDENGLKLTHVLKSGTQVLFYQNTPDKLKSLPISELSKRLYRVTVMEGARCKFNYHMTAKTSGELGSGLSQINWEKTQSELRLNLTLNKVNLVVEGEDFILTNTGEIEWRF
jgi:CRISPR-associated endonuclease Csn1